MTMIGWLVLFVVLVGIEASTMALTTIWFAGGALAAFLAAVADCSLKVQFVIFLLASSVLLYFTRPFAVKFFNKETVKTNAAGLIGKKARVTEAIDNRLSQGAAVVNGQEWTARTEDETQVIPEGTVVMIKEIRGVKLIVEQVKEES